MGERHRADRARRIRRRRAARARRVLTRRGALRLRPRRPVVGVPGRPPSAGRDDWPLVGIFAQRAKDRPNRIGSTVCEVVGVDGTALEVRGLDAVDGTPVLDLKPYLSGFAPRGARAPAGVGAGADGRLLVATARAWSWWWWGSAGRAGTGPGRRRARASGRGRDRARRGGDGDRRSGRGRGAHERGEDRVVAGREAAEMRGLGRGVARADRSRRVEGGAHPATRSNPQRSVRRRATVMPADCVVSAGTSVPPDRAPTHTDGPGWRGRPTPHSRPWFRPVIVSPPNMLQRRAYCVTPGCRTQPTFVANPRRPTGFTMAATVAALPSSVLVTATMAPPTVRSA